jgi:aryl-alcohol dehydrogenase-like predicted oxidoreductase
MSTATKRFPALNEIATKKRTLGKSNLSITPIGFGAWAIGGGGWEFGWGAQDDLDSVGAIRRAVSLGVNWIDTAAVYGLGHSEVVVAKALRDIPKAERPYVFTKCSLIWSEQRVISHSLEGWSVRRECEASLKRLEADTIDLYQIHWANFRGAQEADSPGSLEEAVGELAKLQKEGKIRHIGVSNLSVGQLERASRIATVVSQQPPYSMLRRAIEAEVLPWCEAHNVGVIVYSPMLSGLLTGSMTKERAENFGADDWRKRNKEFQEPQLSKNLEFVETLRGIGQRHGRSPGEVAVAWVLRRPAVTGAIVGSRSAQQMEGVAGALTFRLSDSELTEIQNALEKREK